MNAGVGTLDYANGAGGRILDLPRSYQDAIATAVRTLHPKTVARHLQRVMASDGYLGSTHPLIRGLDSDGLCEFHRRFGKPRRK